MCGSWLALWLLCAAARAQEPTPNNSELLTFGIPANEAWVDPGIEVQAGEPLSISASGTIIVEPEGKSGLARIPPTIVGPEGTFFHAEEFATRPFPLPAANLGPAPSYCLIGRIGNNPPFFIGRRRSWKPDHTGPLYLGINDFDVSNNSGELEVRVSRPRVVQPLTFEHVVTAHDSPGSPAAGCKAVVFYIDGLRPDIIREMSAMGHVPNITALFLEGGTWCENSFTGFPSDTITSNGTMWTGCFSDRHGLKGQVRFSRRTLASESYLEPLGPSRSARLLAPQGIAKALQNAEVGAIQLFAGEEKAQQVRQTQTSGIPPLYEHLKRNGSDWATGALPMMTEIPPLLWTRSLTRHTPYFGAHQSWQYIDDANTEYALYHLLERRRPITIVWLPETDSVSHKQNRGQFGTTRRTIAKADALLGEIVAELEARGEFDSTYFVLVSDHGHHGGRATHLTNYDLANEFFHRSREVTKDGQWIGGGLGMSVREHRFWNRHPEDSASDFVFLDADATGAARIFLPRGHFRSRDWYGLPRPGDMLAYRISPNVPPVDLVTSLASTTTINPNGQVERPVDLVLLKLNESSMLISTFDRGHAVIDRKFEDGKWIYHYSIVHNVRPATDGSVMYEENLRATTDPLLLLENIPPRLLEYYHDERQWLNMTAATPYPDSIVALARHMLWQENLAQREKDDAPDLVVTARGGWYFGHKSSPGTAHGHPLPDAMRASLFVSGPNIRKGARVEEPCRLADLTPTLLDMIGLPVEPGEFDGRALRTIYEAPQQVSMIAARPVYWQDVDLNGWSMLDYQPLPPYEHLPKSINRSASPFDLNNMTYSVLSIADYNILGVFDDICTPLSGGRYGRFSMARAVERLDNRARRSPVPAVAEAAEALDASQVTVGDYSVRSLGNMKRIDGGIDWVQARGRAVGKKVAAPIGRDSLPGAPLVHGVIDCAQEGFWEVYRFAQRVIVCVLDETVINGIENTTDRAINHFHRQPAEIIVPCPPQIAPDLPPAPAE